MRPSRPTASDVDLAIRTLWSLSRSAFHNWPALEMTQIAICLAVIEGEVATEAQVVSGPGHKPADTDRVGLILGGLVLSAIRWMDDLDMSPHTYIRKAIAAQRMHVSDV